MNRKTTYIAVGFFFALLASCTTGPSRTVDIQASMDNILPLKDDSHATSATRLRDGLYENTAQDIAMYADNYARRYYRNGGSLLWTDRWGVRPQADSLLQWIHDPQAIGLGKGAFLTQQIEQDLEVLSSPGENTSFTIARLEYNLTRAFLRYAAGQRYGYVQPHQHISTYTIPIEEASDSFYVAAIDHVRHATMSSFLQEVEPSDTLYRTLLHEYQNSKAAGESARSRLARINMERARWRYTRPHNLTEGKYVWVNLSSFMLAAKDVKEDSVLTMRVCTGSKDHHSPILTSDIGYVELNPYWNVPYSIIKNEIAPRHAGSNAYFDRNRIRVLDKNTGEQVDPATLSSAEMASGRYALRQDNGEGNSLGRMIFRFPNTFSVYLHDTNNRGAFGQSNRALSHGCIRLEKPLELALFLSEMSDEEEIDRLRLTIGREPLTEYGRRLREQNPDKKWMSRITLDAKPHVYLDYYTLYPSPTTGLLEQSSDHYGYDALIEKALDQL